MIPGGPVLATPWLRGGASDTSTVLVSHTVFRYDRWRDLPAIGRDAQRAARLWSRQPGAVALRQWVQPGRRRMGDLSTWSSERDLAEFLSLPEHQDLMASWRGRMRGEHHSWTAPGAVLSADRARIWSTALSLLIGH